MAGSLNGKTTKWRSTRYIKCSYFPETGICRSVSLLAEKMEILQAANEPGTRAIKLFFFVTNTSEE